MQGNGRVRDAFLDLLIDRRREGQIDGEKLQKCESVLARSPSIRQAVRDYLKDIVDHASEERTLKAKTDQLPDDPASGVHLLDREEEVERWLLDECEHFEERFSELLATKHGWFIGADCSYRGCASLGGRR
jgi:hypothetical protein